MELGKRIKEYRDLKGWNQDELSEKMFVSRQTISNWENDKTYPDMQSILLLSNLYEVSLDQLVKGDIEKMKKIVNEEDVKEMNRYSKIMGLGLLVFVVSTAPLAILLKFRAAIPLAIIYIPTMWAAFKVEKIKSENDVQTYKEIIAFQNGTYLDDITKQREIGKRPYQKGLLPVVFGLVAAVIVSVVGLICYFLLR